MEKTVSQRESAPAPECAISQTTKKIIDGLAKSGSVDVKLLDKYLGFNPGHESYCKKMGYKISNGNLDDNDIANELTELTKLYRETGYDNTVRNIIMGVVEPIIEQIFAQRKSSLMSCGADYKTAKETFFCSAYFTLSDWLDDHMQNLLTTTEPIDKMSRGFINVLRLRLGGFQTIPNVMEAINGSPVKERVEYQIAKAEAEFETEHGRRPSYKELAEICNCSERKIREYEELAISKNHVSIESTVSGNDSEEVPLSEVIEDRNESNSPDSVVDEDYKRRFKADMLKVVRGTFTEDTFSSEVIDLFYGLTRGKAMSQREVAHKLGVYDKKIERTLAKALPILEEPMKKLCETYKLVV